jgi:hypothetical protein
MHRVTQRRDLGRLACEQPGVFVLDLKDAGDPQPQLEQATCPDFDIGHNFPGRRQRHRDQAAWAITRLVRCPIAAKRPSMSASMSASISP